MRLLISGLALSLGPLAFPARLPYSVVTRYSRPYLPIVDSPALRFRVPEPALDLGARPVAGGPPVAAGNPEVAEITHANNDAVTTTPPFPIATPPTPEPEKEPTAKVIEPPKVAAPPAILPDDTRPKVRSEDFLPYFTFPGSGSSPDDVRVIAPGVPTPPAPGTLPPSSATYRQQ